MIEVEIIKCPRCRGRKSFEYKIFINFEFIGRVLLCSTCNGFGEILIIPKNFKVVDNAIGDVYKKILEDNKGTFLD